MEASGAPRKVIVPRRFQGRVSTVRAGTLTVLVLIVAVYLAFTKFINTIRQEPTVRRLLPVVPEDEDIDASAPIQYLFEPDAETVLGAILPRLVEVAVYQAVLESKASQFSAQMVAMRNATDAAGDLIGELTLAANKARQTRITKEMLEIASGAEALSKG